MARSRIIGKLERQLRTIRQLWLAPRYLREVAARANSIRENFGPVHHEDLVVVAVMRDAEKHVESFIRHHLQLGARHVVLMDNNSVDGSVDRALQSEKVTVLECDIPYATHKFAMKRYLCDRFGQGCWCLIADIDERFDYPYSSELPLSDFLGYLNRREFSAVVAQMLDLFSAGPLNKWPDAADAIEKECRFFDVSRVKRRAYWKHATNIVDHRHVQTWKGGIRKTAFAMKYDLALTKHPLLFPGRGASPCLSSAHQCRNAHIGDVTCVLKHYKFDGDFCRKCELAVDRKNYHRESAEYRAYLSVLQEKPNLSLKQATAQEYVSASALAEAGILWVSPAYRHYCQSMSRREAA